MPSHPSKPAFWFPAKRFGWGWGLPVCWQGWSVLIGYFALLVVGIRYLSQQPGASVSQRLAYGGVLTLILVVVVTIKGERPVKWRWGRD